MQTKSKRLWKKFVEKKNVYEMQKKEKENEEKKSVTIGKKKRFVRMEKDL